MDLIDRQAAIDALEKIPIREFKKTDGLLDALVSIGEVYRALKQLPSAQQNRLERAVAGKSPEEICDFLCWLMFDYARAYTDSRAAVIVWLKGESDG